jgi:ABC-type sugar transport system substrate-binding protein
MQAQRRGYRVLASRLRRGVLLAVLGAVGIAFVVAGGSSAATSNPTAKPRVGFAVPFRAVDVYKPIAAGALLEAKKRGYTLLQDTGGTSASAQLAEVNTWIAQGVEVIVVFPLNAKAFGPVVKRAHKKGIKVIGYGEHVPGEDGSIVFNNAQGASLLGTVTGNYVNQKLGGKAKMAVFSYIEGGPETIKRVDGAINKIKAIAPGADEVARAESADTATAFDKGKPMLQANPDINVLFAVTDANVLGFAAALKSVGKEGSSVWFATYDGSTSVLQQMETGDLNGVNAVLPLTAIGRSVVWTGANARSGKGPSKFAPNYFVVSSSQKTLLRTLLKQRGK